MKDKVFGLASFAKAQVEEKVMKKVSSKPSVLQKPGSTDSGGSQRNGQQQQKTMSGRIIANGSGSFRNATGANVNLPVNGSGSFRQASPGGSRRISVVSVNPNAQRYVRTLFLWDILTFQQNEYCYLSLF
jgi:hypothetical protein